MGARLGARFGERMEIVGGLILLGIGVQIVLSHV
jgi:putative Mn2+ efflux pump MntP